MATQKRSLFGKSQSVKGRPVAQKRKSLKASKTSPLRRSRVVARAQKGRMAGAVRSPRAA